MLALNNMRVFVALDLDEEIRKRVQRFVDDVRESAPDARWVAPESLHITLKFIGEKPDALVKQVESTLGSITVAPFRITFMGTGFFPTPGAARIFWVGTQAEPGLAELAAKIEDSVADLGIPKEQHGFNPHLTLARASGRSGAPAWRKGDKPNREFAKLQQNLEQSAPPDFGTMTAQEFFLYRSQLSSKGSQYSKIARFRLS
jgi:RNA 2',3'-cyclic 3'-phosphodiesterase